MKNIAFVFATVILFSAHAVSAQSFYPTPTAFSSYTAPTASYNTGCVSISRDLTVGSRGTDVTTLQSFLVSRNYPGGGSWMVTGYFGAATRAAVINFQMDARLPQTGWVDAATRAALSSGCGYSSNYSNNYLNTWNTPYSYSPVNTNTVTPWVPNNYANTTYINPCNTYPSYYSCSNTTALSLTHLSPNAGGVGTMVTVFGTGFTSTGNSVRFGNGVIANLNSTDSRSLSFTVPSTLTGYGSQNVYLGTYNVSVTNSYGATSNVLPFTVTSLGSNNAPTISSVSGPNTIAVNTTGTWTVSLNNYLNNNNYTSVSVNWGEPAIVSSVSAAQQVYSGSQTVTFTHSYSQAGTYTVVFNASNGQGQSNSATATVVVTGSSNTGYVISYISPNAGRVGTQVQIVGTGFSAMDNTVHFGNGGTMHMPAVNGTTIYFTIPQYVSPCDVLMSGYACTMSVQQVTPGSYQLYVSNSYSSTNAVTFTVQ